MFSLPDIMLWAAGATLLGALWFYLRGGELGSRRLIADRFVYAHTALLTVAAVFLFYLFLSDRFQYQYVTHNSSHDLPLFYKISAFWAGQEGTFLLWAWLTAVLALFVIRRGGEFRRLAMVYLLLTQVFLLVLLVVRSPFALVPGGVVPPDGNGLNPLLKDPWMVIHPPIVFVGYAGFAVPFAYALAALTRRQWLSPAATIFPWAAFATTVLGLGIFIGGFWAYKVLGWGGYWGWDPVENASLVPWLTGLASLHALLLYRGRGQLAKTALFLAIISYVLIIYGTFLTRSGVLADFSVHSFTDVGINVYLTAYLVAVTLCSLGLLIVRGRRLAAPPISRAVNSREFGIVLGVLLLGLTAALVLVGTSSPIFTGLLGPPGNVSTSYYNSIALPLGIFIALVLGFSPFLLFELIPWGELFRAAAPSFLIAAAVTGTVVWFSSLLWMHAVLVFVAVLALASNLIAMIRFSGGRLVRAAGHLTHVGFAIMVLGIIASSAYSREERVTVRSGEQVTAFGYDITFNGTAAGVNPEEGFLDLQLRKGARVFAARPRLYTSEYTQQVMRAPYVQKNLLYDLYVAPLDHQTADGDGNVLSLTRGEPQPYGDWTLTFERFETGEHAQTGAMRVGAVIAAVRETDTIYVVPALETGPGGQHTFPTPLEGTNLTLSLMGMSVEKRQIALAIDDPDAAGSGGGEEVVLAVSRKPLTSFVWAGCAIVTFGSGLSFWRRRREATLLAE